MPEILLRDQVWIKVHGQLEKRYKGEVVIVKSDQSEAIVVLENGVNVRVPTSALELRESHE